MISPVRLLVRHSPVPALLHFSLPHVETGSMHAELTGQFADVIPSFMRRTALSRKTMEYLVCFDIDALHSLKSVELRSVSFWGRSPALIATKSSTAQDRKSVV